MAMLERPSTRLLAGCVLGLALLLGGTALLDLLGASRAMRTPLGPVSLPGLAVVALSMAVAALVAGHGFQRLAPALVAASSIAGIAIAWAMAPAGMPGVPGWIARNYGFMLVLELGTAWLGAFAGERLAQRLALRRAVRTAS
ncbi:hypothetical protein [Lysobacter sp. N42]|jgi:hypothetical protein|uniref:hypothetical protein n=1 Tax=Lysobacter sp. N42 TaxID=2545719 RepID=UPI001046701A|nr:hypothetical protein [Lysobacter sp. N42]TCZ78553.1 hypothetical protein EYQ95_25610 [Lysobacter sp. N42]